MFFFDNMVSQIYHSELKLNKAYTSATETAFLDLHLSISCDIASTKIYHKLDNFDFEIVPFPFQMAISLALHPMEFISLNSSVLLIASSYIANFITHSKLLTQKFLKQCYRYHKLHKTFSKFYR